MLKNPLEKASSDQRSVNPSDNPSMNLLTNMVNLLVHLLIHLVVPLLIKPLENMSGSRCMWPPQPSLMRCSPPWRKV